VSSHAMALPRAQNRSTTQSEPIIGLPNARALEANNVGSEQSRTTLLQRLANRTAACTATAIIKRLSSEVFETLTLDNGKEFAEHLRVAKELSGDVYFCDPYSPWQRPSNENSNRISRRRFPKGTDFNKISDDEVARVEYMLNNRPRKILGYATPWEIYSGRAELPEGGAL